MEIKSPFATLFRSREVTITHAIGQPDTVTINTPSYIADVPTKVYKRRWYVLLVYSLLAFTQGGLWNTWGPIAASTEEAFGWTDPDIALLSNWGPIAFILAAFILSWVVDVKGLRLACLSAAFMVALGAGLRCITDDPKYVKWTVNAGQLLNGLAGPVGMGVPPALSSIWFPKDQRTTSTAIASILNILGVGVSFLIGPYIVRSSPPFNSNSSDYRSEEDGNVTTIRIHNERKEIMMLMYIECAWAVLIFLMILVYFPSKPPLPPTLSASVDRVDFKTGAKALLRNKMFWILCYSYGVSLGIYSCWQSVLEVILKPHGISQEMSGWLGFYSIIAGCITSLIVAKFADVFSRHIRLFLILLAASGSACFVWFTLLIKEQLPSSTVSLYVSIILTTVFLNTSVPLYYEMAVEVTHPVAEGITNFVLTFVFNIGGLIFLGIQMVPNIGTSWANWCALGAMLSCIPILLLLKERYNRLEIDDTNKKENVENVKIKTIQ